MCLDKGYLRLWAYWYFNGDREPVVDAAEKPEVKELLADSRFVDDLCHSDDDHERLVEHVQEYIKVCSQFNFEHGDVSSIHNVYEGNRPVEDKFQVEHIFQI